MGGMCCGGARGRGLRQAQATEERWKGGRGRAEGGGRGGSGWGVDAIFIGIGAGWAGVSWVGMAIQSGTGGLGPEVACLR